LLAQDEQPEPRADGVKAGGNRLAEDFRGGPRFGGGIEQDAIELARVDDRERADVEEQRPASASEVMEFSGVQYLAHVEGKNGRMTCGSSDGNHMAM